MKTMKQWLATLLTLGTMSVASPAEAQSPFSEIVVFGDSISDTGNTFLGFLGGGVAAAPPYHEGRFSNGPLWVDVLAEELGLPAPEPSLIGGPNYAWGGAETGLGLSFFGTPNVGLQIEFFLADQEALTGDELIVLLAGANDLEWRPPYSPGLVVQNLAKHISTLAAAGGRTFLVPNQPYLSNSDLKREINILLPRALNRLQDRLEITIVQFDLGAVVREIRRVAEEFGLTNINDPACPGCGTGIPAPNAPDTLVPNPDEYFFWDQIHWTRVVHQIIGNAAAETVRFSVEF